MQLFKLRKLTGRIFLPFNLSPAVQVCVSYILIHLFILHGNITNSQYDQLPVGLIVQLVRALHWHRGDHGFESRSRMCFFFLFRLSFRNGVKKGSFFYLIFHPQFKHMSHIFIFSVTCKLCVGFLSFGRRLGSVTYPSSSVFGEEPSVCVSWVVRRQICCYQEILGVKRQLDVRTNRNTWQRKVTSLKWSLIHDIQNTDQTLTLFTLVRKA